jgi:hypothetical protein
MLDFTDPQTLAWVAWVGLTLTIVGIVAPIVQHRLQSGNKVLAYELVLDMPLALVGMPLHERPIVFAETKPRDAHWLAVRITNLGRPITAQDYERPLELAVSPSAQILKAEIIETKPRTLRASIAIDEMTKLVFTPILLNQGDSVLINMLVNQFDGNIDVDGRIVGVDLKDGRINEGLTIWLLIMGWVLGLGLILIAPIGPPLGPLGLIQLKMTGFGFFVYNIGMLISIALVLTGFVRMWMSSLRELKNENALYDIQKMSRKKGRVTVYPRRRRLRGDSAERTPEKR